MPTDPTYQYTIEDIRRYLSGSMSPAEMHEMEKAALSDPLLADALDGYRSATPSVTDAHLNEIRSRIGGNPARAAKQSPVIALPKTRVRWWRGLAAAAVISIMAAGAWFFMQPERSAPVAPIANIAQPAAPPATQEPAESAAAKTVLPADTAVIRARASNTAAVPEKKAVRGPTGKSDRPVVAAAPAPLAAEQKPPVADQLVASESREIAGLAMRNDTLRSGLNVAQSSIRIRGAGTLAKETKAAPEGNNYVMVRQQERYYSGKVTDNKGNPIPGVTVTAPFNHSTLSNIDGSFRLPAQDSAGNLAFTAPGYNYKIQQLLAGKVAGIELTESDTPVNEVVVVGYGRQKKRAIIGSISSHKVDTLPYKESPYPQGGWDSFYSNLTTEMGVNKNSATKELHLRFTVENGLPEKFTVIKSPDEATAQKAISIIKKGPKWKANRKKKKVDVKIKVD